MQKNKMRKTLLALLMAVIMVIELIPMSLLSVFAENSAAKGITVYQGGTPAVADRDTSMKYTESLGDNASTENSGRIWTDKSVYAGNASFQTMNGNTLTYKLNENGSVGEDFLVAYSALATTDAIEGQTQSPVDVVLIIDISGSMSNADSNMDNGKSRIYNTVQAANQAIEQLMALNEYTRVAVVAFSSTAQVLLPLDRYTKSTTVERQWVSTGNAFWDGYWENVEVELDYLTVSRDTGSSNYATLETVAVNSSNDEIKKSVSVEGGTNIQLGLYTGMNVLATEKNITANVEGDVIKRTPSVILLSDGAPTYSSSSVSWWAPANNSNDGPGSSTYAGNGMKAILVGSYMKDAIDRNYGLSGGNYGTTVYTVGMGIKDLTASESNLAYMTLDPGSFWNTTGTNSMRDTIKGYWRSYTANDNTGTLNINVGEYSNNRYRDKNYALTHPTTGYDVNPADGYDYVDAYYDADNASAVTSVFKEIVSSISISAPRVPTELKGDAPINNTGYITYTDPIGEYMTVKDVKAIIYAGTEFKNKDVAVDGNVTTYTFTGVVDSPAYGHQELKDILITVDKDAGGNEKIVIEIPASVIPLRVNYITLNSDESVKTHTNNGAFPARIIYSVGLNPSVVKHDDQGNPYVDKTLLSAEYLAKNTNTDGTVNFYSNLYTNTNTVHGYTAGDTTVEFEPSHTNGYYYILEDTPIYKDSGFTMQVPASEGLDDNTTYYYHMYYYHGAERVEKAVARTGAQLKLTAVNTGSDGYLYRASGSPRLNRILEFEGTKIDNVTKTAEDFYAPVFVHAENNPDPYEGKFVIYHGNNGVMSLSAGGNLQITKKVTAAEGLTAPDTAFEFTIDLDGENVNQGEYSYVITDESGQNAGSGTVSASANKIYLKNGQTATIYSLPPGTQYAVTETEVDGFTTVATGESGAIAANVTSSALFTNGYDVEPVTFPSEGTLGGVKELEGRKWQDGDSFTFFMTPYNNAPLPAGYNAGTGVTVTQPDVADGQTASFDFGSIEFTLPGVYRYTIYEKEPESSEYLPGMFYSVALYRVVITVVDNGDGTLAVSEYDVQRLQDDRANLLFTYGSNNEIIMNPGEEGQDAVKFTNTYSAGSVVRTPVAFKEYTDNSGTNPLVSGMFEFKLEAVGYIPEGGELVEDKTKVPMPSNAENGVALVANEGKNITFMPIEFTHSHIPQGTNSVVFRYKMSEVVPANKLYGMEYDTTEHYVDVTVSVDGTSDVLNVSFVYAAGETAITFRNEYTPDPAVADINGTKTLTGRDMKAGEAFTFELAPYDEATQNAISGGTVAIPLRSVAVAGGKDGVAESFNFGNISFSKAGTYKFKITEVKGSAPSVVYDESEVIVTLVIDDVNDDGKLDVVSAVYSNGKTSADFVNSYTAKFEGTPVSLAGSKTLTGKTLLENEFFFNVVEYYNGVKISEGLVSHTSDTVADANGVYEGDIKFIDGKTYDKAGTYTYYITEQIPNPKVGGTTYDESRYRFTVTVSDVEKVGKLTVTSAVLEKADGTGWTAAEKAVFANEYVPTPTTAVLPLIKKVLAGERSEPLKAGEFEFEIKSVSQSPAGGMILPVNTVVTNGADGSVLFDAITFTKAGTYVVTVTEKIPDDADKAAGITYSAQQITATYTVGDDRNGTLTAVLSQLVGGEVIVNHYNAEPATAEIVIEKELEGREWQTGDKFDFEVVVLDPDTQAAIENGYIEFPMDTGTSHIEVKSIENEGDTIVGTVTIHRAGTYKFVVREMTGNIPGIHYDSQPREVVIKAADDSENAKIVITINDNPVDTVNLVFTNKYDATSTELSGHDNLAVEKVFTGRPEDKWLDTDVFEFVLEAGNTATADAITNGDVVMPATTTLSLSNANKAYPHFGNIVFHKEGAYEFKVRELEGNIPGVTYDATERKVVVVVTDNNAGELVATLLPESEALTFNNSYFAKEVKLEGKTNIKVIKSLVGREWNEDDFFTFVISPFGSVTSGAIADGLVVMPTSRNFTVAATDADEYDGKVSSYGDITFKKAGSYRFVITEVAGSLDNMSYDGHSFYVLVNVTDNDLGQLVTSVSYVGSNVFTNTYTPDSVTETLEGKKEIEGNRGLAADEFEFTLSAITPDAPMPEDNTVKNGEGGLIKFGEITFDKVGTYEYQITESEGTIPGITYDKTPVKVTVVVGYDAIAGEFTTEVTYVKGEEQPSDSFVFVNKYKAEDSDPVVIELKKEIEVSEGNSYTVSGGEFNFVITGSENAPMPADTSVTNDNKGNASFGEIVFDKAGTYIYTVSETEGSLKGFGYDGRKYTVKVTVTDNTNTAKLETSVEITDENGNPAAIVFTNSYDPKDAEARIFGKKTLEGGYREVKENQFEFVIEAITEGAPMPAETTVKNGANGFFEFGEITFTKVGVYEYRISENDLGEKGYTYTDKTFTVKITVTDENGELKAVVEGIGTALEPVINFVNKYTPEVGSITLEGEKTLNGGRELKDGEFEFVIEAITEGAPLPADLKAENKGKDISFGSITFTEAGTYEYRITETVGTIHGVTYDSVAVKAVVTVAFDDTLGGLVATVKYAKGTGALKDSFEFVNEYKADSSDPVVIDLKKEVEASEGNSYTMAGGEFNFVITGSENAPMPADTSVTNDNKGNASFGEIVFDKAGTYIYTVSEESGSLGGITYDGTDYTVTVTVTDNTELGKLEATVKITDENGEPATIVFKNKYDPKSASAIFFGIKELDSEHKDLEKDEFKFKLEAVTENAPMPIETTVSNDATGKFGFDTITFTKVGVYEYKITEADLGEDGYTYSDSVFTVKVTVTDENGQLKAEVDGLGTTEEPAVKFVNKYEPKGVTVVLGKDGELEKSLDGRELKEEFEFVLTDSGNKVVATAKNDLEGEFSFTLNFTKAGTYKYTITEKNNGLGGVTYDESVYTVTVTVADKGGYLEVTDVKYELEGTAVNKVEFKNTYKPAPVEVNVEASKRIENAFLEKGDFKFEIKDSEGKVVRSGENDKEGKIVFENLKFENAGTYEYTLTEVKESREGVTYDSTVYTVKIVVKDEGDGRLTAETVYGKEGSSDTVEAVTFVNVYKVPNVPQTGDKTPMEMWFALLFVSGMGIAVTSFFGKKKKKAEINK